MSHFSVVRTQLRDETALIQALADRGFPVVERHEEAQPLYGFQGDVREQTAEIIVRRAFVGAASNDIGFKRNADGHFDAFISEFDREHRGYNRTWLDALAQRYAYHHVVATVAKQGYNVAANEVHADGTLKLVLRRYA